MGDDFQTAQLRITGRVQGVGYRAWMAATAEQLGLLGWVRNRSDGSVEAQVQGKPEVIAQMIDACWEGPWAAEVRQVERSDADDGDLSRFEVRPTV